MSVKTSVTAATLALLYGLASQAFAQSSDSSSDRMKVTVGLKAWATHWETWNNPQESETASKWALIPNAAVSWREFFASVGYFARTTYHMPSLEDSKRDELDLNVGYWVLQGDGGRLGVSLGYKTVRQSFEADSWDARIKAPTIGFTGSANITGPWNLYANGAWGRAKETATSPGFGDFSASGYYNSAEAGIAYVFAKSAAVTAGFKHQVIDVWKGSCSDNSQTPGNHCRDTTDGLIVGMNYTF